ncbi:MAG: hypothetical protein ACLRYI_08980 [Bacteroides uniformis]
MKSCLHDAGVPSVIFSPNMAFRYWVRSCDWRILRCIEREEKEETFFGVSSSCRPFFPAT